jgi:5'-nucleotidase
MHIIVTNDDGIFAPGIICLAEALSKIAKVTVIAPDQNKSGVSSAISLETPLRVFEKAPGWFQVNGTPADCIKLALSGFISEEPDIVVSGINSSANLGDDVIYSGTVGGAIEGRFLRLPAIAVSCVGKSSYHFETAAHVAVELVKRLNHHPLESGLILNVNVPNVPLVELKGIQVTRQGEREFAEPLKPTVDGHGRNIYWLGDVGRSKDDTEGTDFHAVLNGYAAVTPMQIDMTAHRKISMVQKWLSE